MNSLLKIFAAVFLLALVFMEAGCAAEEDSAYFNPSDSPPSKDDSGHGWGTAIQAPPSAK